jgi:hypothetical protein
MMKKLEILILIAEITMVAFLIDASSKEQKRMSDIEQNIIERIDSLEVLIIPKPELSKVSEK